MPDLTPPPADLAQAERHVRRWLDRSRLTNNVPLSLPDLHLSTLLAELDRRGTAETSTRQVSSTVSSADEAQVSAPAAASRGASSSAETDASEPAHHVETWMSDEGVRDYGWQCFTCGADDGGFVNLSAAEKSGDRHITKAEAWRGADAAVRGKVVRGEPTETTRTSGYGPDPARRLLSDLLAVINRYEGFCPEQCMDEIHDVLSAWLDKPPRTGNDQPPAQPDPRLQIVAPHIAHTIEAIEGDLRCNPDCLDDIRAVAEIAASAARVALGMCPACSDHQPGTYPTDRVDPGYAWPEECGECDGTGWTRAALAGSGTPPEAADTADTAQESDHV